MLVACKTGEPKKYASSGKTVSIKCMRIFYPVLHEEEEGERFKAMFCVQFPRARLHKLCHQIDGLIFFLSKSIHCLVVCTLPLALNTAHHMLKVIGETSIFSSTTHQFFLWSFYRSNFFIFLARNQTQCMYLVKYSTQFKNSK